ncbi:hypothetical protein [Algoriphagus winogradskyi]|uniref:YopA central domain-containing protein n=1 Tax=Algoriphagus winogradskyi TaxID=237017 RepID=A0ABY1P9J7_9BACT|nr:hypothetical protein [Algoriphagus winogradskyi]SMP28179.1 hypothetical protein SAMN06265367_105272 [Algoriphagus winogradskyi]
MNKALQSSIIMNLPNEEVEIFAGTLTISGQESIGRIYHQWLPFDQTKFTIENFAGKIIDLLNAEVEVTFSDVIKAKFRIQSIKEGDSTLVTGILVSSLFIMSPSQPNEKIKYVDFILLNFRPYFGKVFEVKPNYFITGELTLFSKECNISIQNRFEHNKTKKLLTENGGFLASHNGRLVFKSPIEESKINFYTKRLSAFLAFLNGRRCGPRFLEGYSTSDELIIKDMTPYFIDQYKYVQSWLPFKFEDNLFNLWDSFLKLTADEKDFERTELIIHWYLEALNNSGFVNGSIILLQNSFEVLYSWLAVEQGIVERIGKNDIEKNWASNKIRSVFMHYGIPTSFPPLYKKVFESFDENKSEDFAYVFPMVRNSFVHYSEQNHNKIEKLHGNHWPLLNCGIFYLELLILKVMRYNGLIRSRVLEPGYPGERQVSILDPLNEI